MYTRICSSTVALGIVLFNLCGQAAGEIRNWTDSTGKHTTEAELISATAVDVQLRLADGKEITIPLKRLCAADRAFVKKQLADEKKPDVDSASKVVRDVAEQFYGDLRTKERELARALLTDAAQAIAKNEDSPLVKLATPDASIRSIRVGRAKISETQAEVPVQVRSDGARHETTLHLRFEGDQWRVFAISMMLGNEERTLDFESEPGSSNEVDPLLSLVGQPLRIEGCMLDGTPLDISRFKGKVVLIDFWATWCGPCRAEMPNILANWQQYHDAGFEVIAISIDKDLGELRKFVVQENPPWTVLADRHPFNRTSMAAAYGIRGIPAFILIGKDGKVAAVHCRGKRLGQKLAELLDK